MTAQKINDCRGARDRTADCAERLAERALDHRRAVHDPVTFGSPAAARSVEPDGVNLVEIGHRAEALGYVAQFADWGDVAVHRIDRFEADQLRPLDRHSFEQAREISRVVVAEDVFFGTAVAYAGDHRGMVQRIGEHDHARHLKRQGRQRRIVGDIARGENQRRLAPVQIGKLALEENGHG